MEQGLFQTRQRIMKMPTETKVASARLTEAIRLFEPGDSNGANATLNLKELSIELEANVKRYDAAVDIAKETIEVIVDELLLRIDFLVCEMHQGWFEEVVSIHDRIIDSASNRIGDGRLSKLLRDYADFLKKQAISFKFNRRIIYR